MQDKKILGLHKDKVHLVSYCPDWVKEFKKEKEILQKILGAIALQIEHVGSTSIPGLSAKPILDIAVAVENIETLAKLIPVLTKAGYDVLNSIENKGEILARKGNTENRTHYIHIEVIGSTYWNDHILFRDYLLKHPEYIKQYENLKESLAIQFQDDRKQYTSAKNEFIQHILKLAADEIVK